MKKLLLLFAFSTSISLGHAQDYKDSYFGIMVGVNQSSNTYGPEISGIETSFKDLGFAGGIFYNKALRDKISVQPEILFSKMGSEITKSSTSTSSVLKLNYLSIPILFKYTPNWRFSIMAGPQLDFMVGASNSPNGLEGVSQTDNFDYYDFGGTIGAELWINRYIGLTGRYIQGFNNVFDQSSPSWAWPASVDNVTNYGWQFGIIVGFKSKVQSEPTAVAPVPVAPVAPSNIDSDADGISDANDKCPTEKGIAKYNGCPIPDSDGDGINDENDRCPKTAGSADNMGCPELMVYFQKEEIGLTDDDKTHLEKAITFLKNNPDINVVVEGHTSAPGGTDYNQTLSEKRAIEVVDYFISQGISSSRMTPKGLGEQFPIGDQNTVEGRATSRRVVIKIAK